MKNVVDVLKRKLETFSSGKIQHELLYSFEMNYQLISNVFFIFISSNSNQIKTQKNNISEG